MCRYAGTASLLIAFINSSNWSKKFPEGFFMQTAAFFNAALRGAFAASAPAVAYARQLLHVRYLEDRDNCESAGEQSPKWGLLNDVNTVPRVKKKGGSNIRFKCTLTDEVLQCRSVAWHCRWHCFSSMYSQVSANDFYRLSVNYYVGALLYASLNGL